MASILEMMGHIQQQGELGRQQGQARRLGDLYSQALQAPQEQRTGLLAQMAQVSPKAAFDAHKFFGEMQDDRRAQLGQYAAAFDALPDDQKAAAYPQLAKQAQELGIPAPSEWRPEFAPNISRLAQALGGGAAGTAEQQNFAAMTQGFTPEQIQEARLIRAGLKPRAGLPKMWDSGDGVYGVDTGRGVAHPITVGGEQPAIPQQQPVQAFMAADGVPVQIDPSLPPNVQAAIRGAEMSGQPVPDTAPPLVQQAPQQLRSAPKPMTPYQEASLDMQRERMRVAEDARRAAEEAKRAAQQAKDDQKRIASEQRQAAAAESANQLVSAIDALTNSSGFSDLGTAWGDVKVNTPLVRNDAKDAQAQLKNIAGQVALTTMNRLKALSSQGATGFGALSAPELKLLENSIATLQSEDISNAELKRSLKTIRDSMEKITSWRPEGGGQGQETPSANGWSIKALD